MTATDESKTRWSELRDLFAATREAMIVTAVLLILLAPSVVRGSLQRAGITSFAGVEFDMEDVLDAGQQVAIAESQVAKLSLQLSNVEQQLADLSVSGRAASSEELREIANSVHSIKNQASEANQSLSNTTQSIDRAIQLMPPDQLRELAAKNARRQEVQQRQPTRLPTLDSARLQGGLLIRPSEISGTTISS
ncbi:MAG: hypothetical protein P8L85_16870 [Rubripirellula sp.]|nr:hypothetical protein [Rubripirellula sp.]